MGRDQERLINKVLEENYARTVKKIEGGKGGGPEMILGGAGADDMTGRSGREGGTGVGEG